MLYVGFVRKRKCITELCIRDLKRKYKIMQYYDCAVGNAGMKVYIYILKFRPRIIPELITNGTNVTKSSLIPNTLI